MRSASLLIDACHFPPERFAMTLLLKAVAPGRRKYSITAPTPSVSVAVTVTCVLRAAPGQYFASPAKIGLGDVVSAFRVGPTFAIVGVGVGVAEAVAVGVTTCAGVAVGVGVGLGEAVLGALGVTFGLDVGGGELGTVDGASLLGSAVGSTKELGSTNSVELALGETTAMSVGDAVAVGEAVALGETSAVAQSAVGSEPVSPSTLTWEAGIQPRPMPGAGR